MKPDTFTLEEQNEIIRDLAIVESEIYSLEHELEYAKLACGSDFHNKNYVKLRIKYINDMPLLQTRYDLIRRQFDSFYEPIQFINMNLTHG